MPARELPVRHGIPSAFQFGHQAAAREIDRQDFVARAMSDEDVRASDTRRGPGEESRRERDEMGEQVAIHQTEREGIGCAVGKATDRDPPSVHGDTFEGVPQRCIDEHHIGSEAASDAVPCRAPGINRQNDDAKLLGQREDVAEEFLTLPGPMHEDQKGKRCLCVGGRGEIQRAIACAAEPQWMLAWLTDHYRCGRPGLQLGDLLTAGDRASRRQHQHHRSH